MITGGWFLTFWAALPFAHRNWGEDEDGDGFIDSAPKDASPSP